MAESERKTGGMGIAASIVVLAIAVSLVGAYLNSLPSGKLSGFSTCGEMVQVFKSSMDSGYGVWGNSRVLKSSGATMQAESMDSALSAVPSSGGQDFSGTNVQVEGVDEADIVKTDGTYIYAVRQEYEDVYYDYYGENPDPGSVLAIAKAYPPEDAAVVSSTDLGDFVPSEMFIEGDRLLVFGTTYRAAERPADDAGGAVMEKYPFYQEPFVSLQLWDISDRSSPELVRTVDFEGSYVTSRKIGSDVYFVVNSYPSYDVLAKTVVTTDEAEGLLPLYKDSNAEDDYVPSCGCADVSYFDEVRAERFLTIASMPMDDDDGEVEKIVVAGSGQNVYASMESLYVAESSWPSWDVFRALAPGPGNTVDTEKTVVHRFSLDGGDIEYESQGSVPGRVLNQFSMDESGGYFRIATTSGRLSRTGSSTSNNVYVLDQSLDTVGAIEDIAPGESIYSARFIGDRGYLVTFKKVDPFFVIDLSDPKDPRILGKLKIPGYSDYLHPYDDDHVIGIGKDTAPSEEGMGDFAWYQGIKMALFDVTDVENPVEMYKAVIGDRGTDSEALRDHKAFLFDRDRELLVIPVLLAEIDGDPQELQDWEYGDYVYQGAYVYRLSLDDGFELMGRVTHFDDDEAFQKSGYYFGTDGRSVRRSLYIGDILYTVSGDVIKANSLQGLSELAKLDMTA